MMVRMRMQGLSEDELHQFVAKFSGRYWEEFFEALFGFEAKLEARLELLRVGSAGPREKHAAWREPILNAINRIEKGRQESREREVLQAVEQANYLATGLAEDAARQKAEVSAAAMVRRAKRARRADADRDPHNPSAPSPMNLHRLLSGAEASAIDLRVEPARRGPFDWLRWLFVGPPVRIFLALFLIFACGLWVHQNYWTDATGPLSVEWAPPSLTFWINGWHVAAAGFLLMVSLFYSSHFTALFGILGSAVIVFGHLYGIRSVEPFRDVHVALILGSVLTLIGFRLGNR
jgi:hypothetical protein